MTCFELQSCSKPEEIRDKIVPEQFLQSQMEDLKVLYVRERHEQVKKLEGWQMTFFKQEEK